MADLNPTDLLLVNRNDTTQKVTQATIMAQLLDDDYMVLQRSDNTYKITGLDFKNSMVDPLVITVTLTPTQPQAQVQETAIVDIAGGKDPYTTTYQWRLKTDAGVESDIVGATQQTYIPVEADVGKFLACVASVVDDYGNAASGASIWSPAILSAQSPPIIGSAVLTETGDGSARFTSQTFSVGVNMTEEGQPAPEYGLKGYVEGTLMAKAVTDEITEVVNSTAPTGWIQSTSMTAAKWWRTAYGNGIFVAVGRNGPLFAWSIDGITWTDGTHNGPNNAEYWCVAFGDGKFIALSDGTGSLATSTDGKTWTVTSTIPTVAWKGLAYGNNTWVAVAADNVLRSTDGVNWTTVNVSSGSWWMVAYGNNTFVSVINGPTSTTLGNKVMYSLDDGVSWSEASSPTDNQFQTIGYGNGKFVVLGIDSASFPNGPEMWSADGITWSTDGVSLAPTGTTWSNVFYDGQQWYAFAQSGSRSLGMSSDGLQWTTEIIPAYEWMGGSSNGSIVVSVAQTGTNPGIVVYEPATTTLTLAGDKDLASFSAGDVVASDPALVRAHTNVITGVGVGGGTGNQYLNGAVWETNQGSINGNWNNIFQNPAPVDSSKFVECTGPQSANSWAYYSPTDTAGGNIFASQNIKIWASTSSASTSGGGTYIQFFYGESDNYQFILNDTGLKEYSYNIPNNETWEINTIGITLGNNATSTKLYSFEIDGVPYGITETQLTFANNSQLENFAVGDLVQQNAPSVGPSTGFTTNLWAGNGIGDSAGQTIVNDLNIAGVGGLVWIKSRNFSADNALFDTNRGPKNELRSNLISETLLDINSLMQFDDNGYDLGGSGEVNLRASSGGGNYVGWTFLKATKFFDVVTYDGTGQNGRTVEHNLNSIPGCIIVKCIDGAAGGGWMVYHSALGASKALQLQLGTAALPNVNFWDNTAPTSVDFTLSADSDVNGATAPYTQYVAYLFAEDEEFVKCGSYTGNDGNQTILTGFKVQWVMIKNAVDDGDWLIFDTSRGVTGNESLYANSISQESGWGGNFSLDVPDGFNINTSNTQINTTGQEYVYVAIAVDATPDILGSPTGLFQSADPAGPTMTLIPQIDGWSANTGNYAIGPQLSGGGVVASTDVANDKMTLSSVTGRWLANVGQKAASNIEVEVAKLYTVLSSSGQVIDLVVNDPGYTTMAGNPGYTLTFPAVFPSGDAPDEDLPAGTSLTVDVGAANVAGSSFVTTNTVVPGPLPGVVDNFAINTWAGTGAQLSITNDLDLQNDGGLVWIKNYDGSQSYCMSDTEQGPTWYMSSNTNSQASNTTTRIESFNDDGFTIYNNPDGQVNGLGGNYVGWSFKSAPRFFDVVEYTGIASAQQIPHNLGVTPGFIITKVTSASNSWYCYHSGIASGNGAARTYYTLDSTEPAGDDSTVWDSTLPTTTNFTVGNANRANQPNENYIAYLFAEDEEFVKCGSYIGSGEAVIDVGFRPQWVLIKGASNQSNWVLFDDERMVGGTSQYPASLKANTAAPEATTTYVIFTDTGWQFTTSNLSDLNIDGQEYTYVAIAAPPTPSVYEAFSTTAYNYDENGVTVMNSVDLSGDNNGLVWLKGSSEAAIKHCLYDTVRGSNKRWTLPDNDAQTTINEQEVIFKSDGFDITGAGSAGNYPNTAEYISWEWKVLPKFFDIVTYTGNGTGQWVNHNLDGRIGLMVIKNLDLVGDPIVYCRFGTGMGAGGYMTFNTTAGATADIYVWNQNTPSETQFQVGASNLVNANGSEYIAYLWSASEDWIKCGDFATSSSTLTVDVGFKPQWLMIKKLTSGDDWMIYDTTRGFTSDRNDSERLLPSSTAAQGGYPFIWQTDTGFSIDGTSVGSYQYIYMAIKEEPTGAFSADSARQLAAFNALKSTFGGYEQQVMDRIANITSVLIAGGYSYNELPKIHGCGDGH